MENAQHKSKKWQIAMVAIAVIIVIIFTLRHKIEEYLYPYKFVTPKKDGGTSTTAQQDEWVYVCQMRDGGVRSTPGPCPKCGMPITEKDKMLRSEYEKGTTTVKLAGEAVRNFGIKTDKVSRLPLTKEIYTVGRITYDERLLANINSRIAGRVDKLFVNFTGVEVKKDDPLVAIYSPDLVSTQEEYILALDTYEKVKTSPYEYVVQSAADHVKSARERLILWGIAEKQIAELEETRKSQVDFTIYSPLAGTVITKDTFEGKYVNQGERLYEIADLSNLWMLADIYEYEMAFIRLGQTVEITSQAYPSDKFTGTISFISPTLNEATRTVSVRVDVPNPVRSNPEGVRDAVPQVDPVRNFSSERSGTDLDKKSATKDISNGVNPDRKLKPAMFVNASIKIPLGEKGIVLDQSALSQKTIYTCQMPEHADVISDKPGDCTKCGMKLIDKTLTFTGEPCICSKDHTTADKMGKCPICGMEVVEKKEGEKTIFACPMSPTCISDKPGTCAVCDSKMIPTTVSTARTALAIPKTAVIDLGAKKVVYKETAENTFTRTEVKVGPVAGEYYPLIDGLNEGDKIVTIGNYMLDSQTQTGGGASALYSGASEVKEEKQKSGHKH